MSKCNICNSRKGKRKCKSRDGFICSECCGAIRQPEHCQGCVFYQSSARNYRQLPRYSKEDMSSSPNLQQIAFPVESSLCVFDRESGHTLSDEQAIDIIETVLDVICFGDSLQDHTDKIERLGFQNVLASIMRKLDKFDKADAAKVIPTVWHLAKNRASGGRHHMDFLQATFGSRL